MIGMGVEVELSQGQNLKEARETEEGTWPKVVGHWWTHCSFVLYNCPVQLHSTLHSDYSRIYSIIYEQNGLGQEIA